MSLTTNSNVIRSNRPASSTSHESLILGGRYRVLNFVEEDPICALYQGQHVRLGRAVKIQFLTESAARDQVLSARFRRVAETMSNLRHPHIVEILEFDETDSGVPYMVLEELESRTLERWLLDQPRRTMREIADLIAQIGSGLSAAHLTNISHGALCPARIVVMDLEAGPFLKLGEFGLTTQDQGPGSVGALKARYWAPEQIRSPERAPTPEVDQYQLATIAYELFSGRGLFPQARDRAELLEHIKATPAPPLRKSRPEASVELEATLLRALSKSPDSRFPSLAEFVSSVRRSVGLPSQRLKPNERDIHRLRAYQEGQSAIERAPTLAGFREREPESSVRPHSGRYSTSELALELDDDLTRARVEQGRGNWSLSLGYLSVVVEKSRRSHERTSQRARSAAEQLLKTWVAHFVDLENTRLSRVPNYSPVGDDVPTSGMRLLELIEQDMSVPELLAASPLESAESWSALATLIFRGAIKAAK